MYVYEDGGAMLFGCLHKVFAAELDLAAFTTAACLVRGSDSYGSLRLNRSPRRQCKITVEQAYPAALADGVCCNPTFFHNPAGAPDERIRLTTNFPPEPQPSD